MKKMIPNISFMKKAIFMFTVAAVMVACNSNPKTEVKVASSADSVRLAADTAGLAQFQAWKAQNERANLNQYNQGAVANTQTTANNQAPRSHSPAHSSAKNRSANRSRGTVYNSESSNTAQASKKKGWSKAAKGAAIGGGAGAVLGAVINKRNRVAGGVIGGVIGAGVGYGIGRSKDKKDGRY